MPKYYEADDVKQLKKARKTPKPPALRKSIQPGQILILLSGRFKGKRVVFLKQLKSGLLLVSGPFKINGVPLRRVNQAYVLATSTKVPVSVDTSSIDDAYFGHKKTKITSTELFGEGKTKQVIEQKRIDDQKRIDKELIASIIKVDGLKQYLNASFALTKGQFPHEMKF